MMPLWNTGIRLSVRVLHFSPFVAVHPKVEFLDYMVFLSFLGEPPYCLTTYIGAYSKLHHFTFPPVTHKDSNFSCIHVKLIFWKVFLFFFKYINSHSRLFVGFAFLKKSCAKKSDLCKICITSSFTQCRSDVGMSKKFQKPTII